MKRISLMLILLICIISCKKDKNTQSCDRIVAVESALAGKWKLIRWSTAGYNQITCGTGGGNWYNTSDWGTNVMLEVRPEGTFRTYKNDTLVNESFATSKKPWGTSNYGESYNVSCSNLHIMFINKNPETDSLHNIQLGDTLQINNPFVDINFFSYPTGTILSITGQQYYVKIE